MEKHLSYPAEALEMNSEQETIWKIKETPYNLIFRKVPLVHEILGDIYSGKQQRLDI